MKALPGPLRLVGSTQIEWAGRRLAFFAGSDYHRLSRHPAVLAAAREILGREGLSVAASRLTTGNHRLYEEFEAWLAEFLAAPAALLVHAGYAGNPILTQVLAGGVTHAFLDARTHPSLREAAVWLDCPVREYAHGDAADLRRQFRRLPANARPLVLTDGVFAHDGSLAPLPDLLETLPRRGLLLLDEAHAAGVLGRGGRGTLEHFGVADPRIIRTATLSKAFGAFGGVVLGSRALLGRIIRRNQWFAGSTPPPLPVIAAARTAGRLIQTDAAMRERLRANTAQLKAAARAGGLSVPDGPAPILALPPASPAATRQLRQALLERDVFPSLIRGYPAGPAAGCFRFTVSSAHTPGQLAALAEALRNEACRK
jgi:7-keto-8-aminopelargonate synthetase-like enzyme